MSRIVPAIAAVLFMACGMSAGLAQPAGNPDGRQHDGVIMRDAAKIRKVTVATLDELSVPQRIAVNRQIAHTGSNELERLRQIIDQTPRLEAALEEFGSSPSFVIAMTYDDTDEVTLVVAS